MPTVEFYGMSDDEQHRWEEYLREQLSDDDFRDDCVFVRNTRSQVTDWKRDGTRFIRVSTGSSHRADRFSQLLQHLCDLEIVQVRFHPRSRTVEG